MPSRCVCCKFSHALMWVCLFLLMPEHHDMKAGLAKRCTIAHTSNKDFRMDQARVMDPKGCYGVPQPAHRGQKKSAGRLGRVVEHEDQVIGQGVSSHRAGVVKLLVRGSLVIRQGGSGQQAGGSGQQTEGQLNWGRQYLGRGPPDLILSPRLLPCKL